MDSEELKSMNETLKKIEEHLAKPKRDFKAFIPVWVAVIALVASVVGYWWKSVADADLAEMKAETDYIIKAFENGENGHERLTNLKLFIEAGLLSEQASIRIDNLLDSSVILANGDVIFLNDYTTAADAKLLHEFGYELYGKEPKSTRFQRNLSAIRLFEASLMIDSVNANVYANMGDARWQVEEYKGAIRAYERSLQLNGGDQARIYYRIGLCYQALDNYDSACKNFNRGLELAPDSSEVEKWIKDDMDCE